MNSGNFLSPTSSRGIDTARKTPLGAGRSLMDWIRKAPKIRPRPEGVTEEELSKHNKETDCWMCVRDIVYDVTAYIVYHPGGRDQIMRGAGIDATDLFNQYHSWVNIQSMLKTCIVGKLDFSKPFKAPNTPVRLALQAVGYGTSKPYFDWMQDDNFVRLFITTNQPFSLRSEYVSVLYKKDHGNELHVFVYFIDYCFYIGYNLSAEISSFEVQIEESKTVKISLNKRESTTWKNIGKPLSDNKALRRTLELPKLKFSVRLSEKTQISHDCYLFTFEPEQTTSISIPIGRHLHLLLPNNQSLIRPYTPVPMSILDKSNYLDQRSISLLIKIYDDGLFTPDLMGVKINDELLMSIPEGNFDLERIRNAVSVLLVAAGTGITPMLGIIHYCLFQQFLDIRRIRLVFFNKTERDMIYSEQLAALKDQFTHYFAVSHVLSAASDTWEGERGRISEKLLKELVPELRTSDDLMEAEEQLICICGPRPFTDSTVDVLNNLQVPSECVHAFKG